MNISGKNNVVVGGGGFSPLSPFDAARANWPTALRLLVDWSIVLVVVAGLGYGYMHRYELAARIAGGDVSNINTDDEAQQPLKERGNAAVTQPTQSTEPQQSAPQAPEGDGAPSDTPPDSQVDPYNDPNAPADGTPRPPEGGGDGTPVDPPVTDPNNPGGL